MFMRTFAPPPINDDSNCWHSLGPCGMTPSRSYSSFPPLQPPSCSPQATPAMTDQEPSRWPRRISWSSPASPARTSSHRVARYLHWSTSAPRRLPGCTPTTDPPPPPKAGHLGQGECNFHAAAAAGSTEDRCQTLPITFTGQGDGAVLTRTRVGGDLCHKLLQLVQINYLTATYSTSTLWLLSTIMWLFLLYVASPMCIQMLLYTSCSPLPGSFCVV